MTIDDIEALEDKRVKVICTNGLTVEGYIEMETDSYDEACVFCGRDGVLDVKLNQIASIQIIEE